MIKPLNDYIVVTIIDENKDEVNGLIVPDTAKAKPNKGKVIAVSDGAKKVIKEGDVVIWPTLLGVNMTIEDQKVVVLKLEDIMVKLSGE